MKTLMASFGLDFCFCKDGGRATFSVELLINPFQT